MKVNRSRLRIEELERRDNPAPVFIGTSPIAGDPTYPAPVLIYNVAGYDIAQVNADSPTTSSAFGFSEASMTAPQAVTTANGGTIQGTLSDAFDGALNWGLAQGNGTVDFGAVGPLTYTDLDGTVDIVSTGPSFGPGTIVSGTPETQSVGGDSFLGLQLAQRNAVFSVNGAPIIRSVFFVTNTTGATISQNLGIFNNFGSDNGTEIFDTSSGDFTFTGGVDTFVGSFAAYSGTTSTDPRLMFQLQGAFGDIEQGLDPSSRFVAGDDQPHFNFFATLAPGETQAFMVFTGLYGSKLAAVTNNSVFSNFDALESSGLLAGLSDRTLNRIQNWDVGTLPDGEVAGSLAGVESRIQSFDSAGNAVLDFAPFVGFTGGVSVARGDINGDGVDDIVAAAGPGANAHVKVFDGVSGAELASFFAFDGYDGGLSVATGDVDNDGVADIIVGTLTNNSHVKVFSGATGAEIRSFFAFEGFNGGVNVGSADVDADGLADILVGSNSGPAHVKVFSGSTVAEIRSFFAFDNYEGGITVAGGDLNEDGFGDIVVGALQGVSHVKSFNGSTQGELSSFFAYDGSLGGVSVAVVDADNDGRADIGTGSRIGSHIKAFNPFSQAEIDSFFTQDNGAAGGLDIA